MAERNGLLNRRTGYTVPWVRIPPSPQTEHLFELNIREVAPPMAGHLLEKKNKNISGSSPANGGTPVGKEE